MSALGVIVTILAGVIIVSFLAVILLAWRVSRNFDKEKWDDLDYDWRDDPNDDLAR